MVSPGYDVIEGSVVTFICKATVGTGPGQLVWLYYLDGSSYPNSISGNHETLTGAHVEGRTCNTTQQSILRLRMVPEFNGAFVRCTLQQTVFTEEGDGFWQTGKFSVRCKYF